MQPKAPAGFSNVFSPIRLGSVEVGNRIVVAAHTTNFGHLHLPTDRHVAYHEARARGGAGLIIFESIRVHPSTLGKDQGIAGFDPDCIPPFRRVADAVHAHGARLFGQVISLGRLVDGDAVRVAPWGPSSKRWSVRSRPARVMDADDIDAMVDGHVATARNVLEAGLDGLEIHLGHGHLLQQFLSPSSNDRTDDYGGTEERRLRLPLEVLTAVRAAIGDDVPMGIRVSADEYLDDGLTLDDMERIVPKILDRVSVDFVHVSHSAYHDSRSLSTQMADMAFTAAPFRDLARSLRRAIRSAGHEVPTIAVCRFTSIEEAEDAISGGVADMVAMARAHIADPDIVRKAATGHSSETRRCIGCNQGCAGFLEKGLPITCLVNPTAGREAHWSPDPGEDRAAEPRRVLVVGGGPAGLEAAWVAAARGHRVALWEKSDRLGGALGWVREMPLRHQILSLLDQQIDACRRHGVAISLGRTATIEAITAERPDTVVVATGATPTPATLPDGSIAMTLTEALGTPWAVGASVAIIDRTGEWSAVSVAEHFARLGRSVTIVTPGPVVAWHVTRYSATALFDRLRRLGVRLLVRRSPISHRDGLLTVEEAGRPPETIPADTVIGAEYPTPVDDLAVALRSAGIPVRRAGDCEAPRTALEAVYEGHAAARAI